MDFDDDAPQATLASLFQRWRLPSLDEAVGELCVWRERFTIYELYPEYFPSQYGALARAIVRSAGPRGRLRGPRVGVL